MRQTFTQSTRRLCSHKLHFRMIFLDSPSTTPLDCEVLEAMLPFMQQGTSGQYLSQAERSGGGSAIRAARESVADALNCLPNEIVWTSGATEANNLAILGFADAKGTPGRIVSQVTEHSAVLEPLKRLKQVGWDVHLLPVDEFGRISLDQLRDSLGETTDLVSIMWGNNEIGTIQPIAEIAELCADRAIPFHCDAAQAMGKVLIDLSKLPIAMLTLSAHKFYGPVGAGSLFVRNRAKRINISPLMYGGGQEHGLRPGTLNVAAIVGLGEACRVSSTHMARWSIQTQAYRERFECLLVRELSGISINGDVKNRLPHITNIAFQGVDNEGLLAMMPEIIASTGSACHYADFNPSHVLNALSKRPDIAECSLRFGFTKNTTSEEVVSAVNKIVEAVNAFRSNC